jgi:hypothetical protein
MLSVVLMMALALSNVVVGQTAAPNSNYVCFTGVQSLNDLIPIIYFAMVAMIGVGAIGTAIMSVRSGNISMRMAMFGGAAFLALSASLMGGIDENRAFAQAAGSCLLRDGSLTMTGNLNMGNNDIVNVENIRTVNATTTTLTATGGGSLTGTWSDLGSVSTVDINGGTIDGATIGGTTPGAGTLTTLTATGGGSLTGTWSDLGSVSTVDINGGTIDGATIGGTTPGAGTLTTLTVDDTTLNGNTISTSAGNLTLNPADTLVISQAVDINMISTDYLTWSGSTNLRDTEPEPWGTISEFVLSSQSVSNGASSELVTFGSSVAYNSMHFVVAELFMSNGLNAVNYVVIAASKRVSGNASVHRLTCVDFSGLGCFISASDFTVVDVTGNKVRLVYTNNEGQTMNYFGMIRTFN